MLHLSASFTVLHDRNPLTACPHCLSRSDVHEYCWARNGSCSDMTVDSLTSGQSLDDVRIRCSAVHRSVRGAAR